MKANRLVHAGLVALGVALVSAGAARAAGFTPIPLNPASFNHDPVIEKTAPPSINDYATVTLDQGTNKSGNTWYEMGYNTNLYTNATYSGPLTGLPFHGTVFTAVSNATHSYMMAPSYNGNCVIFVGHNNSSWTPIMGPGTFTVTTPAAYKALSVISGTGNGPALIKYTVHFADASPDETGTFSSTDWFTGANATTAWRAGGLLSLNNGGINNQNGNPGTVWFSDITLLNQTSPIGSIDFAWYGNGTGKNPWSNGRTYIFGMSGSTDATNFSPIVVTGYDHDGIMESNAPITSGAGSVALTGTLTNGSTYCTFTMDGNLAKSGSTWFEAGYYAAYPNSGVPAAGSTITSLSKPEIQYTMASTYVGNCAYALSVAVSNATMTFASGTSAGSLAFLVGGGNGGLNIRAEIQFSGGASETNWITAPDWFERSVNQPAYVCFGRMAPGTSAINNTPDQLGNDFIPVVPATGGGIPAGQPFSRDPRNGGANFNNLPGVRLFDAIIPVANSGGTITSINLVVTNLTGGNSATIFAVSGSPGAPPLITTEPFGLVTDSVTGNTNAITGQAQLNNIVITKGFQGTNNISLIVSNASFSSGVSYQWKKAPRGGGWRDRFFSFDMSTFANVTAPNVGGVQNSVMTISNATLADSADYLVVLSNAYGMQTSFVASVMVLTTNLGILVGSGLGDTITKYTSDHDSANGAETFLSAIDQVEQKWLSQGVGGFGFDSAAISFGTVPFVGPAGYIVTPVNGSSIVNTIRFYCANDSQGRDPRDYFLEGSNDGTTWTPITGGQLLGTLMLPTARGGTGSTPISPFTQPLMEVDFANATAYKSYRLTITNNMEPIATSLMQIAEIQFLGTLIPNPPVWVRQPVPAVTAFVGTSPTWGVLAGGYPAPKFQWYTNGVLVPGATNATFTIANVQVIPNSGEQVSVVAFNTGGSLPSTVSTLTVVTAPTQSYPSAVLANGPMAYWRLDEGPDNGAGNDGVIAHDYAGGHNGYYSNVVIGVAGYSPASDPDTAAQFDFFVPSDNFVAGINNVDFARGTNTPGAVFSVEAWVFSDNQTTNSAILTKGYNGALNAGTGTGTEQFVLDVAGGTPFAFRFMVRDFFGNGHPAQSAVVPRVPQTGASWHHLVGVCDQPNANVLLYVDGLLAATGTIPSNAGIISQTLPMTIGSRQTTAASDYNDQWSGTIDEVAMYPSALTASQVFNHFLAAQRPPLITQQPTNTTTADNVSVTFATEAYGPGTLGFQWWNSDGFNLTTPVAGQTSSNLTFTTTPAANGTFYQLVVTNNYGAVTSVVAQLTVLSGAPSFITDVPASQTYFLGHYIQLHVVPGGTAPFTYQWQKGGVNIVDDYRTFGSTSDTLTIGYATFTDTASYQVIVTGVGSTPSTADAITVTTNASGFFTASANASDWTLNGGATISGQSITLTVNAGNTARSGFLNTKQNISSFNAEYTYQMVLPSGGGGADGVTFCIQNQAVTVVGGGGGGLAYSGITPSVGLALNVYQPQTRGVSLFQNGTVVTPFNSLLPVIDVGGNNDPIKVDVSYNGTVLTAKWTDTVTLSTVTSNFTVNIPSIVGASTAYVGFTGADGGVNSQQVISWAAPAATRIPLNAQRVGGDLVLSWPASAGAYLLNASTLSNPVWTDDMIDTYRVVGANANVTVVPANVTQYFRLQLFP